MTPLYNQSRFRFVFFSISHVHAFVHIRILHWAEIAIWISEKDTIIIFFIGMSIEMKSREMAIKVANYDNVRLLRFFRK